MRNYVENAEKGTVGYRDLAYAIFRHHQVLLKSQRLERNTAAPTNWLFGRLLPCQTVKVLFFIFPLTHLNDLSQNLTYSLAQYVVLKFIARLDPKQGRHHSIWNHLENYSSWFVSL